MIYDVIVIGGRSAGVTAALRGRSENRPGASGKGESMTSPTLTHRLAQRTDLDMLKELMDAATSYLPRPFLSQAQIASSQTIMGLDTQLIDDGTYFVVEAEGEPAGCGGWSRRATMYGGDQTPGRSAALLDPAQDPARISAMYTHPKHTRFSRRRPDVKMKQAYIS